MDINQLKAFDCVVRLGSFSKAARYLHLSQPTISMRIQGLEKQVGGSLFNKVGKSLELSDLGRGFLPYARQALDTLAKGIERAKSIQQGKKGQIKVGTLPTFTTGRFSSAMINLYEKYPEINVEIHTGHNQQIIEMLYDGEIKIGFMTNPFFNTDLKKLTILKEPLVLVAHHTHPIVKGIKEKSYTLNEIIKESCPYIVVDWSMESKQWQKANLQFGMEHLELPPYSALDFICSGKGITLLTETMAADFIKSETLVKIQHKALPELNRELAMVSLDSESSLTPAYKTFKEIVASFD